MEREVLLGDGRRPAAHRGRAARPDRLRRHVLGVGPVGDAQPELVHPPLDERRAGVPPRRRHRPAARPAAGRRRHRHRDRRPRQRLLHRPRGARQSRHLGVARQRHDVDEERGRGAEHGGRPAVVRGRQRADVVRGRQHGLPRVPPDLGRHVHLLVARIDGRERSRRRARVAELVVEPERARAARGRRDLRTDSASTPSRATSTTRATRATTSA